MFTLNSFSNSKSVEIPSTFLEKSGLKKLVVSNVICNVCEVVINYSEYYLRHTENSNCVLQCSTESFSSNRSERKLLLDFFYLA